MVAKWRAHFEKRRIKLFEAYLTPDALALACCRHLEAQGIQPRTILEPSAGNGAYVRAARLVWPAAEVTAVEIRPACERALINSGVAHLFLQPLETVDLRSFGSFDLVLGNPPFSLAESHIPRLLKFTRQLSFLLRLSFLGTKRRALDFWPRYPLQSLQPFADRPTFLGTGSSDNSEYGLYTWRPTKRPPRVTLQGHPSPAVDLERRAMTHYLLLDGKNTLWRAASVLPDLSSRGRPTGGIHGFMMMLARLADEFPKVRLVVCWDDWKEGPLHRRKLAATYKVRGEMDPEAKQRWKDVQYQMHEVIEFLRYLNVKQVYSPRWEADDAMGTLARRYVLKKSRVTLFTGDRDLLQCLGPRVSVARPKFNGEFETVTQESFTAAMGFGPDYFTQYKAIVGDPSDGYPGCKGIGAKGATNIVKSFGTVEKALHAAEKLPQVWAAQGLKPREAKLLLDGQNDVEICLKLATINQKAPITNLKRDPNFRAARDMLKKWNMVLLLTKFSRFKRLAWEDVA